MIWQAVHCPLSWKTLDDAQRVSEEAIQRDWDLRLPQMRGCLFSLASQVKPIAEKTSTVGAPRMADIFRVCTARDTLVGQIPSLGDVLGPSSAAGRMKNIVQDLAAEGMDEFFRVIVDHGEVIEGAPGKVISHVSDLARRESTDTTYFPGARGFSTLWKQNQATLTRLGWDVEDFKDTKTGKKAYRLTPPA